MPDGMHIMQDPVCWKSRDDRKGTKKPDSKYFQQQVHNFNKQMKFIIDKLLNLHGSKEKMRELLVIRENFWIQKMKA